MHVSALIEAEIVKELEETGPGDAVWVPNQAKHYAIGTLRKLLKEALKMELEEISKKGTEISKDMLDPWKEESVGRVLQIKVISPGVVSMVENEWPLFDKVNREGNGNSIENIFQRLPEKTCLIKASGTYYASLTPHFREPHEREIEELKICIGNPKEALMELEDKLSNKK